MKLKKHTVGTLNDAYDALVDGYIVCNPKYSPYQDQKFKYAKMQVLQDGSIFAYGLGKVMMLDHFLNYFNWPDGWEIYYSEMHNDRIITIDDKEYRLSENDIDTIMATIESLISKEV